MVKLRHRHNADHDEAALRPPATEDAVDAAPRTNDRLVEDSAADERRWAAENDRTAYRPTGSGEPVAQPPDGRSTAVAPTVERPVVDRPVVERPVVERPGVTPVESTAESASAVTTETVVTWGPGQFLGLLVGVGMLILGTVALTRSGLDFSRLYSPHVEVAGLHHTPLLGVLEVGFGLLVIAASAVPGTMRGLLVLLGVVALGSGIVTMVATGTSLHDRLGVHRANGWLFIVDGALLILAAMLPGARVREVKVSGRRRGMRVR